MTFLSTLRTQWDRTAAIGALVLALLVLLLGYVGVSGTEFVAEQLPYVISGGLVGLVFVVAGATLWISADLRDEWRKLDALDARLEKALTSAQPAPEVAVTPSPAAAAPVDLTPVDLTPIDLTPAGPARVGPTRVAPTRVAPTRVSPARVAPARVTPTRVTSTRVGPVEAAPTGAPTRRAPRPRQTAGRAASISPE